MDITISAKNFKLTPANKEYVTEKMGKLGRYSKRMQRVGVELDIDHSAKSGNIHRVEVWAYFPEKTLSAGQKAEHMNEAIDLVYPKMERLITKHEGKRRDSKRPSRI